MKQEYRKIISYHYLFPCLPILLLVTFLASCSSPAPAPAPENAGHLYEAAYTHYLATGKRNFLDIALKNADLMVAIFGEEAGDRVTLVESWDGKDESMGEPAGQEISTAIT